MADTQAEEKKPIELTDKDLPVAPLKKMPPEIAKSLIADMEQDHWRMIAAGEFIMLPVDGLIAENNKDTESRKERGVKIEELSASKKREDREEMKKLIQENKNLSNAIKTRHNEIQQRYTKRAEYMAQAESAQQMVEFIAKNV